MTTCCPTSCCVIGGCTQARPRSTGAVTGDRCLSTEVGATTKICLEQKRNRWPSCSFSKSTCGWTEEPEPCFWISPSTMETSTYFALSGEKQKRSFTEIPEKNENLIHLLHASGCWWSFLLLGGCWPPGSSRLCVWFDTCPAGTTLWACVRWRSVYSSCTT